MAEEKSSIRAPGGAAKDHAAAHYDRVHDAWLLIMGEEFHYGYFATRDTPLEEATAALTEQMRKRAAIAGGDRVLESAAVLGGRRASSHPSWTRGYWGSPPASGASTPPRAAGARGIENARFEQRDGIDNGLESESFDVVWVLESSHLMRDRALLLRECARVLGDGGRFVLCDIIRKREIPFAEVRDRVKDFATLRAVFGNAHMQPLESYTSTLEQLGMSVTDASDITEPTLPTFAAWRANIEAHVSTLRDLISSKGVADYVDATNILESFWLDGTLGYGILAAVKRPNLPRSTA